MFERPGGLLQAAPGRSREGELPLLKGADAALRKGRRPLGLAGGAQLSGRRPASFREAMGRRGYPHREETFLPVANPATRAITNSAKNT